MTNDFINTDTIFGLERGRAEFAYECALEGAHNDAIRSEYKAYVKKIPMYIKTNGLGAAFAFVMSKSKDTGNRGKAYKMIYEQTKKWLKKDDKMLINLDGNKEFAYEIVKLPSSQYRAVTIEVLSFFNWLRRFAEGLIEE